MSPREGREEGGGDGEAPGRNQEQRNGKGNRVVRGEVINRRGKRGLSEETNAFPIPFPIP